MLWPNYCSLFFLVWLHDVVFIEFIDIITFSSPWSHWTKHAIYTRQKFSEPWNCNLPQYADKFRRTIYFTDQIWGICWLFLEVEWPIRCEQFKLTTLIVNSDVKVLKIQDEAWLGNTANGRRAVFLGGSTQQRAWELIIGIEVLYFRVNPRYYNLKVIQLGVRYEESGSRWVVPHKIIRRE